jgi:TonB family protein
MSPRFTPAALLIFPLMAASLAAQHVLMAENDGKMSWVRAASGSAPCVERDGKIGPISSRGYLLKGAPEYLPAFVTVRDVFWRVTYETQAGSVGTGKLLRYNATLETGYRLDDVFLVLSIGQGTAYSTISISEVAHLEPNQERPVSSYLPLGDTMAAETFQMFLFSGGQEVLQSEIAPEVREAALDRMVASRIRDVRAAGPKLFFAPAPEYPSSLRAANLRGQAMIAIRIGVNGAACEPVVKSATDPAFGEAALNAIRLWRFLPTVKDGHPVETRAVVPFAFEQPKPEKNPS